MRIQAKVQLKNYEMLSRREKLGYSLKQLEISSDIGHQRLSRIENMKVKPTESEALELSLVLNTKVKILFPDGYEKIIKNIKETKLKKVVDYVPPLLDGDRELLMLDAKRSVEKLKTCLTPKERAIIDMRYGIEDSEGIQSYEVSSNTGEEISKIFGCTRENIFRIERTAIDKMRKKNRELFNKYKKKKNEKRRNPILELRHDRVEEKVRREHCPNREGIDW